jgi:hypothetical protein
MRHYLGLSEFYYRQRGGQQSPVHYEPEKLINAHVLMCGMSGTGKSWQSKRFLASAVADGLEVDVFDVHDELDGLPGSVAVKYSQATGYGYNPMELDTDPHTGGVNRQVDWLVKLIKDVTPQLGVKQEAVIRNLLHDTYLMAGIYADNPRSWVRDRITEQQRREIMEARQWSALRQYYPTLDDLMSYGKRKLVALTLGGDNKSITALEALMKHFKRLNTLQGKYAKSHDDAEIEKLQKATEAAKEHCNGTYRDFIEAMKSGRELDDVLKYDSVEVLTSAMQRLDVLNAAGIFRANPPPFGKAKARVHQIKSLSTEQQVLFVKLRLQAIFERWKGVGATRSGTEVRHIIFLDEGHKFFSKEPDDIVNVIAKEARKFGIGLWCASQSPTSFPEDFRTNAGAVVLLGIDSSYWADTQRKMRITEDQLKFTKPKEVISVKLKKEGMADPPFGNIIVPNPASEAGKLAAKNG